MLINSWQYRWSWQLFQNYPRHWWKYQTRRIKSFAFFIAFAILWTGVLSLMLQMLLSQ